MSDTCVVVPDSPLGQWVRAFMWRDSGAAALPQLNRFPAAPFCTVTWCLAGTLHIGESPAGPGLDAVIVGGPGTRPMVTSSPGRLHAFTIVFFPDAFARLTGLSPGALVNQLVPARSVLPPDWHDFMRGIAAAADSAERMQRAERFLARRCGIGPGPSGRVTSQSWLHGIRQNLDAKGLCERQVERKIKQATGQSLRALRCSGRFEAAVLQARGAARDGALSWAKVASETGYADQSHICREFRKMSGSTPGGLIAPDEGEDGKESKESKESYWIYHHWK